MADEIVAQGENQTVPPAVVVTPQEPEKTVPYDRFKEVNDGYKEALEQNRQLLETIQQRLTPPPAEDPNDALLDPSVVALKQENAKLKQAVGGLADQMDRVQVRSNPEFKDYHKYESQVEAARKVLASQGQYVPREQVYLYIKGQEALKKGGTVANAPVQTLPADEPQSQPIPQPTAAAPTNATKKEPEPGTPEFTEKYGNISI
jgi:hypothetical protein